MLLPDGATVPSPHRYLINFLLDATVGMLLIYVGVRAVSVLVEWQQWESLRFGEYGNTPGTQTRHEGGRLAGALLQPVDLERSWWLSLLWWRGWLGGLSTLLCQCWRSHVCGVWVRVPA